MRLLASTTLIGLLGLGCGFDDASGPGTNPIPADAGLPGSDTLTPQKMQPPVPDPLPPSVCTDTVPVQGTAAPGSSVIVFGGSSSVSTDANPSTGRFCLDVPLVKNSANTLQIRAQDPILGMSDPVTRSVTHSGNCNDDVPNPTPDPVKSKNVALGSTGKSSQTPDEGNEGFLTDGDTAKPVVYSGGWTLSDPDIWTYIKLDKVYMLEKIVVKWRDGVQAGGSSYGKIYHVLVSSMSDPGDPDLKNGYWTEVAKIDNGDGDTDTFDLKSTKPLAQYVAVWMKGDGQTSWWSETFALTEIEVWDSPQQTSTPTPTTTNTCSTLGS